jgi:hypothetical protein
MRTHPITTFTKTVLVTLIAVLPALARDHKDLNGTWTLAPTRSDFNGQPVMETGTVTIDEREGNISVTRHFVYTGANTTFYYNDAADSQNGAKIHSGDVTSKAKWDHDVLKVTTTEAGKTTVESYSLAADGAMTVIVEKPGRSPVTLVFEHK